MPIIQQGSVNTTSLIVPDLYVQIVPPQNLVLNGVPTNVLGVVGTASWGPVNQPSIVSTMATATTLGCLVHLAPASSIWAPRWLRAVQPGGTEFSVCPRNGRERHGCCILCRAPTPVLVRSTLVPWAIRLRLPLVQAQSLQRGSCRSRRQASSRKYLMV